MRYILANSDKSLEINTLFIQPSRYCWMNCEGCYVKAHAQEIQNLTPRLIGQLITEFSRGEKAWANQITISIDSPSGLPLSILDKEKKGRQKFLLSTFKEIVKTTENRAESDKPEIHLTFHNFLTLKEYIRLLSMNLMQLDTFSLLSFSNIRRTDSWNLSYLKKVIPKTVINYNYLIPTTGNIDKQILELAIVEPFVDSIYMIAHKRVISSENLPGTWKGSDCDYAIKRAKKFADRALAISDIFLKRKLIVDSCLIDSKEYIEQGYSCPANISKFQVWPNGSVTGCPYSYNGGPTPATSIDEIIENIRAARTAHDFAGCYIPSCLSGEAYGRTSKKIAG